MDHPRALSNRAIRFALAGAMALSACMFSSAQAASGLVEYQCGTLPKLGDGKLGAYQVQPDLYVLSDTRETHRFTYDKDTLRKTAAIMCVRSSVVPEPTDFLVVDAGFPLFLRLQAPGKMVALEASGGAYQVRVVSGDLTADEQTRTAAAIDQAMDDRAKRKPSP